MILKKIKLLNFRNYKKASIDFDKNINIIIGNNAVGKTNILESIYVLALTKSYRTQDINLIEKNSEFTKVKGEIREENILRNLEVFITKDSKKVYLNNNEIKKISDYITYMNVISVCPEDINILKGTPADRRNFLNIELSQISINYIKKYIEFNKILKIRNNYLKMLYQSSFKDVRYLDSLTENLVDREIDIYIERKKFINLLNERIEEIYREITGKPGFNIIYKSSSEVILDDIEGFRNSLLEKYKKNQNKEIENGMTLYGPHRDDLEFYLGDDDIRIFGSEGQQKVALIAIKLAEISIFKELTNSYPIILLDDIFSELDVRTRNRIINYLNENLQVVITSNDTKGISKKILDRAKIFKVSDGNIDVIEKVNNNGK